MIVRICHTESIKKHSITTVLNSPKHIAAIKELNGEMETVRRDFILKNYNSEKSAASSILTA